MESGFEGNFVTGFTNDSIRALTASGCARDNLGQDLDESGLDFTKDPGQDFDDLIRDVSNFKSSPNLTIGLIS